MNELDYQDFKAKLAYYFFKVEKCQETLIIKQNSGERIVMVSLSEYNSMKETLHLLGSKANADRLFESIQQMERNLE